MFGRRDDAESSEELLEKEREEQLEPEKDDRQDKERAHPQRDAPADEPEQRSESAHRQMFRHTVIRRPFAKSMKNAPTIGTTRKAFGAGPCRSTTASMLAIAFAVVPSMNPQNPEAITADS